MVRHGLALALVLAAGIAPLAAQQPDSSAMPPIHPNDLNYDSAQQRIDEIRRSGNTADLPQMNSLESTVQQSRSMNSPPGQSRGAPLPGPRMTGDGLLMPPPVGQGGSSFGR